MTTCDHDVISSFIHFRWIWKRFHKMDLEIRQGWIYQHNKWCHYIVFYIKRFYNMYEKIMKYLLFKSFIYKSMYQYSLWHTSTRAIMDEWCHISPLFDITKMLMGNLGIKDVIFPVKCLISSVLRKEMSIRGE